MSDDDQAQQFPIEISFLKGLKSVPSRKTFKTRAGLERWLDKNDENITILAHTFLEPV